MPGVVLLLPLLLCGLIEAVYTNEYRGYLPFLQRCNTTSEGLEYNVKRSKDCSPSLEYPRVECRESPGRANLCVGARKDTITLILKPPEDASVQYFKAFYIEIFWKRVPQGTCFFLTPNSSVNSSFPSKVQLDCEYDALPESMVDIFIQTLPGPIPSSCSIKRANLTNVNLPGKPKLMCTDLERAIRQESHLQTNVKTTKTTNKSPNATSTLSDSDLTGEKSLNNSYNSEYIVPVVAVSGIILVAFVIVLAVVCFRKKCVVCCSKKNDELLNSPSSSLGRNSYTLNALQERETIQESYRRQIMDLNGFGNKNDIESTSQA